MRLGNLQHVLQWDNAIAKRVSLVHPDLVDEPLDFVMSMNNIDPDLLYHVQELTESGMRQPPDTDISRFLLADARTPWRVKRWVQSEYSLMALRRYTKTLKKSRKVHQTVVTDVIRSLLSTFRSGTGKSRAATTFGFMPVAPRSDRGLSKKMRKRGEGAGVSRGTSRVPPWSCSVSTRWRDMGLHVFPRYIQETDCRRNNNSTHTPHSHPHPHPDPDPPTCYDGHYHCRPTTTAVQVLVRHPGNCNDSRVPVNIRDYYFLSVVTIPTGCQCGP
nr:hypothetical protein BaRGS_005305 [Batillaria attramentaria]